MRYEQLLKIGKKSLSYFYNMNNNKIIPALLFQNHYCYI